MPTNEEIDRFCKKLAEVWKITPNITFGHHVMLIAMHNYSDFPNGSCDRGTVHYTAINEQKLECWERALDENLDRYKKDLKEWEDVMKK